MKAISDSSPAERVGLALEGETHDVLAEIALDLAAIVAAETPNPVLAGELFGKEAGERALAIRARVVCSPAP